ncbi:MAG: ECF-type sigma factor [Gemmatimonadales bacterium]
MTGSETDPPASVERLVAGLYDELRRLARIHLRRERREHTLGTTGLVHEAYLRLAGQEGLAGADRTHFFAAASNTMRRVLVDYARRRNRAKRGGGAQAVPLDDVAEYLSEAEATELLALDAALERLAAVDPRGSAVVEHRFFGGLSQEETADLLGVSTKTIQRDWLAARAWLRKEVARDLGPFDEPT